MTLHKHKAIAFAGLLFAQSMATAAEPSAESEPKKFTDEDRSWWAVQPLAEPEIPQFGKGWVRNGIDGFIARKLEESNLEPAPEADKTELIRRACFDLHGLPPTPEQIEEFLADDKPGAWERLIDRLLESPRYGERWAQHWLDVVRYAESDGYRQDAFRPGARRYRDYVIKSFNEDKPYNQFVREQLAGDEIDPNNPDVLIGTSYLRQGVYEYNQRNARMHWDLILDDITGTTGETFLGIGIGCAQCHDHKFDPILQTDYFRLRAFFSTVSWPTDRMLGTKDQLEEYEHKMEAWEAATEGIRSEMQSMIQAEYDKKAKFAVGQFPDDIQEMYYKPEDERNAYEEQMAMLVARQVDWGTRDVDAGKLFKNKPDQLKRYKELQEELKKYEDMKPASLPEAFIASDVGTEPAATVIKKRAGEEEVEPGFLALLGLDAPEIEPTATTTGRRTALADWIASEDNPLSTRVIVNRIWQKHFSRGLVMTPNDFGTLGQPPSHPELLDWLTVQFLEGGWQFKDLHRLVMTSATYRQTARREPGETENSIDPTNQLLWRFPPHRLEAETIRDAMLLVSGELRHRDAGPSVSGNDPYRSIYVKKIRNNPDEMVSGFDSPDGFSSSPERIDTTTPTQSLMLLNGNWTLARARSFASRILKGKKQFTADEVNHAFQLAYGRTALPDEVDASVDFVLSSSKTMKVAPVAANPADKFPDETGLRPISQVFGQVGGIKLGESSLWIQPDSRFERLHWSEVPELDDTFGIEAVANLDRLYKDASVNTLISRWDGSKDQGGWSVGVTSEKSSYTPRNLIMQLVGSDFQGNTIYEVVPSDLFVPLGKPVYIAVSVSAKPMDKEKTKGSVTFYLKDLSDPDAKLQTSVVKTDVVGKIQVPEFKVLVGGRQQPGHQWDGQVGRVTFHGEEIAKPSILGGGPVAEGGKRALADWKFSKVGEGGSPIPGTRWLPSMENKSSAPVSRDPLFLAVADFCHALLSSNEFLYLH